ncbi:MAG: FecR domain-containing protein [Leptospiraceae bacterium]|nr:FecR domain-containing protein [Leptospiraceae bacterium]
MGNNMNDDRTEKEKKIESALFNKEDNEYSLKINNINSLLSKKNSPNRKFKDFESLIEEDDNNSNVIQYRKKSMNKKITIFLAAAAMLLVGVFVAINQSSDGGGQNKELAQTAKVIFISGEVAIKTWDGQELPKPKVGTVLKAKDSIVTANKSSVELLMNNGTTLKVKSNSEFSITKIDINEEVSDEEVFLKRGLVVADVKKKKQTDNFRVTTPTVIAGVRGTKFQVEVNPNKNSENSTRVIVDNGAVGITKRTSEGKPATPEPIEIIEANETVVEKGFGGNIVKENVTSEILEKELEKTNDASSESDLINTHGRTEIEKLTLEDNTIIRGVITDMDETNFTVQTLNGVIKVSRSKVISSDTEKLK